MAAFLVLVLQVATVCADDSSPKQLSSDGLKALLEQQHGQVLIVNLWATWCAPCIREIPELMELELEFASQGVRLVAVNMDDPSDQERVREFVTDHFSDLHTYQRSDFDMDTLVSVIDPAWNEILPSTYLVDRKGAVAVKIQGRKTPEEFRAEIEALL
jgi:thiol-disulfide isomerase/thioredoxin